MTDNPALPRWVLEQRGTDALTRHFVLWHETAPDVVYRSLLSIELADSDSGRPKDADELIFDAVFAESPARFDWLIKSKTPINGPNIEPATLIWMGEPKHLGYRIRHDLLRIVPVSR